MPTLPADYQAASKLLDQQVILITGAGDGIGAAAAEQAAALGATVILLGRTSKKLELNYDRIVRNGHPEPALYPLDHMQATPTDYANLATTIQDTFGRLDGLLMCAAEPGMTTPFDRYNPEDWLKVIHTNLTAPFAMLQALYPLLLTTGQTHGHATVAYCTDEDLASGQAFRAAFSASKAGLQSLMQAFADETEHHGVLRVNGIDPQAVNTATRRKMYPGADNDKLPKPAEFAQQLMYLFDPACNTTGSVYTAG